MFICMTRIKWTYYEIVRATVPYLKLLNFNYQSIQGVATEHCRATLILVSVGKRSLCSVHSLLSSRFLRKNLKIKIYKTIILLLVLYGCESWSHTKGRT
jgi:hypothetical protein